MGRALQQSSQGRNREPLRVHSQGARKRKRLWLCSGIFVALPKLATVCIVGTTREAALPSGTAKPNTGSVPWCKSFPRLLVQAKARTQGEMVTMGTGLVGSRCLFFP